MGLDYSILGGISIHDHTWPGGGNSMWRSRCQIVCLFQFTHVLYRYDMCIIIVCNSDSFTYLIFTSYKCIKMCVKKTSEMCWLYIYMHMQIRFILVTCSIMCFCFIISLLNLDNVWYTSGPNSRRYLPRCKRHHQWGSRNGRGLEILELHRHIGPVNSHYGPFSLQKTHLSKIKTKSLFCRKKTILVLGSCLSLLSFSL